MAQRKKSNYLNNKDLLAETIKSKELGKMTPTLAHMLTLLVARYASKSNFNGYSFNLDMQAYALLKLVESWKAFDPTRSENPNPFAFYTQCIKNSFIQFLNVEKRQRNIRDKLLVSQGLTPSYTYQIEQQNSSSYEHTDYFDNPETLEDTL